VPRLLVSIGTQRNQMFELTPGEIMVGRDKDAGLQLPNESVSRQHAGLVVDARGVTVEDNASGNGTLVNERPLVAPRKLESGDEVRIGKFTLVFLSDERRDLFYKGRAVKYMPVWSPRQDLAPAHTFLLSKDALRTIQDQHNLIEDARIVLDRDPSSFWCPEDHKITFGSGSALIRPARLVRLGRRGAGDLGRQTPRARAARALGAREGERAERECRPAAAPWRPLSGGPKPVSV